MSQPYEILRTTGSAVDLEKQVCDAMARGYQPLGGPFYWHESREWHQAVVKPNGNGNSPIQPVTPPFPQPKRR